MIMPIKWSGLILSVAILCDIVFGAPVVPEPQNTTITKSEYNLLTQFVNTKYPLTDPILLPDGSLKYRIAIISDLDGDSISTQEPYTWISYFKQGHLIYNPNNNKNISIEWDSANNSIEFKSHISMNGRGLELSELVTYNGQLITFDDKTGVAYIIEGNVLIPWVIIVDGDGRRTIGMKNEWATIKDSKLYVGSHGKEIVSKNGLNVTGYSNMWVKVIDQNGAIKNLNWTENFIKLRAAFGIHFPGYMTHESCVWSDVHNRWFFLPRKASMEPFSYVDDERKATNVLLSATSNFDDIKVMRIGEVVPNHGYASFKFIPGTNDTLIVAIKSMEENDVTATFIIAFSIDGKIIYPETKVSDLKFEGLDFI